MSKIAGRQEMKKNEEMARAPPRNKSDWLDWEEARSAVKSAWRLGPEGKTEVPEIVIVSDAVESTYVDLDGKSRRERAEAKISGRERSTRRRGQGD